MFQHLQLLLFLSYLSSITKKSNINIAKNVIWCSVLKLIDCWFEHPWLLVKKLVELLPSPTNMTNWSIFVQYYVCLSWTFAWTRSKHLQLLTLVHLWKEVVDNVYINNRMECTCCYNRESETNIINRKKILCLVKRGFCKQKLYNKKET